VRWQKTIDLVEDHERLQLPRAAKPAHPAQYLLEHHAEREGLLFVVEVPVELGLV